MKLVYSAEADTNLDEILDYGVENWGVERAIAYLELLQDEILVLIDHPELGKKYQSDFVLLSESLRALDIDNYKIIYRLNDEIIEIISILPKGRPLLLGKT
ncbi:type II toxin-antitoxin system RelE/ParE family toxin [Hellea sp.]|nr:type II toxin-antitoxin system RelE/ParE family toxin [Hellea sp.]